MINMIVEKIVKKYLNKFEKPNTLDDVFNNLKKIKEGFYNFYFKILSEKLPYPQIKIEKIAREDFEKNLKVGWEDGRPILESKYGCSKTIFDESIDRGYILMHMLEPDPSIFKLFRFSKCKKEKEGFYLVKIEKEKWNLFLFNYFNLIWRQAYKYRISN